MAEHLRDATKKMEFISREAAEAAMTALRQEDIDAFGMVIPECFPSASAIGALKKIPAADVRPVVKARWEDETGYIFNLLAQRVYCPICKSYAYFYPITTKNFCPNCGADMRETGR